MLERIYNNKIVAKFRSLVDGKLFPVFVGAFILLFYLLKWHIPALAVLAFIVSLILLCCKDIRPALSPVMLAHLVLCHYYPEIGRASYLKTSSIIVYAIMGSLVISSLAFNLLAYRKQRKLQKSKLFTGLAVMCCAFLLGGAFSGYYGIYNFSTGIVFTLAYLVAYLVFFVAMEHREDNLRYIALVCCVSASVVVCQIAHIYIVKFESGMALGDGWKSSIVAGWGISNTLGEFLAMFMPSVFYLIYKEKRGYFYYILAVIMFVAMYLTLCRAALIFGGLAFVVGAVVNCFKGKNRKINTIIAISIFVIGTALIILELTSGLFDKMLAFFSQTGIDDRGRFFIWKEWIRLWKEEPMLGVGFRAYRIVYPDAYAINAHNTIIQMLAGTGIMGLVLYIYHRVETVKLFVKKPTIDRLFGGGLALVGVLVSFLDPLFFRMYFAFYYSLTLLTVEKSLLYDEQKENKSDDDERKE